MNCSKFASFNRLRTRYPAHPANIAFTIPTPKKGMKPDNTASVQDSYTINFNQTEPKSKVINTPKILEKTASKIVKGHFSKYRPIHNTAGMNPIIKPPVEPNITPNPAVIPAKIG